VLQIMRAAFTELAIGRATAHSGSTPYSAGWPHVYMGVVSLLYLLACALQYRYLNNMYTHDSFGRTQLPH
jgi:hypothetical protein